MALADALTDAEVAVRAAGAGAAAAHARFGGQHRRIEHDGVDFSTEADIAAEHAIRSVLSELRPDDAVLGEELGSSGDSRRRWLVDPICGTLNFAAGLPLYAVNVALEVDAVTVAAAVADPIGRHTLWADGLSAWRRAAGSGAAGHADQPLAPSSASRLVSLDVARSDPESIFALLSSDELFRARFSPRAFSTTLALAWVATGQQAAYITGGDLRSSVHWAAGIALCRAAGVVLTNLAGGELHTGDHGMVAAADAETHDFLLTALHSPR